MTYIDINKLPDNAQLSLSDLETSKAKNRQGITRLSGSHIRRLEAQGLFPKSRFIQGTRCKFFLVGEVREWLNKQATNMEA